ncbi:HD-GYP domain-containing protein [Sporosarcina sp. ACRSL]|uniref:HD-GYP domain-containing protein n=1 Tax=Sporosarcina sp. ACRSL TaxID=2918215 RepID=UPI001EF4C85D|nr:HD-GYP domain-containing protein [Sporosarcina sp. ACRSL]MCG7346131.1 HD-GYP domain-containing protein [Sporosarcina sp. ACRSL]
MKIYKRNSISKISMKGMELSLLASGDGTEVILHKLYKGARWAMAPEDDWTALEHFTILSGELIYLSPDGEILLEAGDSVNACPVTEHSIFIAKTDVDFLYVTSQPQFHFYSNAVTDMMDLALQVEQKDGYTADHCERIKELSMMVGNVLGLSSNEIYILNLAAFLHDVGKVKVPEKILNKPSKLTDEEYEIMKKHTTWGKEILNETNFVDLIKAGEIVEQHHERFDGKGYPKNLKGEEISIEAAIISVVDAFDAMTSDRVYRKGLDINIAFEEIENNKGTMFNPEVVDAFLSLRDKLSVEKEVIL